MEITESQFHEFETVRQSGICNMYDSRTIMEVTSLDRDQIRYIMSHYDDLAKEFGTEVDEEEVESLSEMME